LRGILKGAVFDVEIIEWDLEGLVFVTLDRKRKL